MKKFGIIALAALLVVAFTMPAAALENTFGGYWRTRFFLQSDFTGSDTEASDISAADTRTRLYYTAKLNDNLKFVNKFEWDATWGSEPLADVGADGKELEIKNSYADFNLGPVNAKVGIHGITLARGFMLADDFTGATLTYKAGQMSFPVMYIKYWEGGSGKDANDGDIETVILNPSFNVDNFTINPFGMYAWSDDATATTDATLSTFSSFNDISMFWVGVNVDAKFGAGSVWFTGIYNGGDREVTGSPSRDVSGFLAAIGGNVDAGPANVHGQVFYATGDDNPADTDDEAFLPPPGRSYYWSEIMGYGIMDNTVTPNSPADGITNILAANIGASFKPMDKLKLTVDLWYAALAEDDAAGNNDLGTEIDLKATYQLVEGLNLDLVAAYLITGDATFLEVAGGPAQENAIELVSRLSLSF